MASQTAENSLPLPALEEIRNLPPVMRNLKYKVLPTGRQIRIVENVTVINEKTGEAKKTVRYHGYVVDGTYYSVESYKDKFDRFGNPRSDTIPSGPARNRPRKPTTVPRPTEAPAPEPVAEAPKVEEIPQKRRGRRPTPVKGAPEETGVSYQFKPRADGGYTVTKVWSRYDPVLKNNHAYKTQVLGISSVKGDITNLRPTSRMKKQQQEDTLKEMRAAAHQAAREPVVSRERIYPLNILIIVALAAAIGGALSCQAIATYWKQHRKYWELIFPDFPELDPSHDVIRKMLERVGVENGNQMLARFLCVNLEGRIEELGQKLRTLHVDGQVIRAATNSRGRAPDVLNLYDSSLGIVLAHELVGAKTNEIPHCCSIIAGMNLLNCIVTCDALNTQKEFARAIVEQCGDYCFAVKGNHSAEELDLMATFNGEPADSSDLRIFDGEFELAHGRIEQRSIRILPARRMSPNVRKLWAGLEEGCLVEATTHCTLKRKDPVDESNLELEGPEGETKKRRTEPTESINKRYFISSLRYDNDNIAKIHAQIIRSHWSVEKMHWGLDMIFLQDRLQCKSGALAMGQSTLNKLADYFLRQIQKLEEAAGRTPQELTRPVLQVKYSNPEVAIPALCEVFHRNMTAGGSQGAAH